MRLQINLLTLIVIFVLLGVNKQALGTNQSHLKINKKIEDLSLANKKILSESNRRIQGFEFTGNTVFSEEELKKILNKYIGKEISPQTGLDIRRTVTDKYVKAGFIASFSTVSQSSKPGFITVVITEAKIEKINIQIKGYLREGYLRSFLEKAWLDRIYNENSIGVDIINFQVRDENIKSLDVKADGESNPGKVVLNVVAEITPAFELSNITSNTGSPTFGETNNIIQVNTRVLGNGDKLNAIYLLSGGNNGFKIDYVTPIFGKTKLILGFSENIGNVTEDPLSFGDINVQSTSYQLGIQYSLINEAYKKFNIGLIGSFEENLGKLQGVRTPIFRGADDRGILRVATIRLPIQYSALKGLNYFEINSEIAIGIDALGATLNEDGFPDGRFVLVNGQFLYQRILDFESRTFFQLTGDFQLASDSLPGFEAKTLGGINLRGYRQGTLFADNILRLSGELNVPLYQNNNKDIRFSFVPFVDIGKACNTKITNTEVNNIFSVGAGLRFSYKDIIFVRLDYGIPLIDPAIEFPNATLQDRGIIFGVSFTPIEF
ncbi:MAG: ShlB/FhaC/HecB family hemolysin secretion/activation protein [Prochloraceae cyanobacterium]